MSWNEKLKGSHVRRQQIGLGGGPAGFFVLFLMMDGVNEGNGFDMSVGSNCTQTLYTQQGLPVEFTKGEKPGGAKH